LQENFPYGLLSRYNQHNYISMQFLEAAYRAGDSTLAARVSGIMQKEFQQEIAYYSSLTGDSQEMFKDDYQQCLYFTKGLQQLEMQFNPKAMPAKSDTNNPINTQPVTKDSPGH
jgi:hypothetical protein